MYLYHIFMIANKTNIDTISIWEENFIKTELEFIEINIHQLIRSYWEFEAIKMVPLILFRERALRHYLTFSSNFRRYFAEADIYLPLKITLWWYVFDRNGQKAHLRTKTFHLSL